VKLQLLIANTIVKLEATAQASLSVSTTRKLRKIVSMIEIP
jgi:hypothetical protein